MSSLAQAGVAVHAAPSERPHRTESAAPQGGALRYRSLDLWRGVACLLVVVYHATYIQCGIATEPSGGATSSVVQWLIGLTHWMDVGVPMFFVISGYCIAAAADGLRHSSRSVGNYFVRRIRRIYPPLWITI